MKRRVKVSSILIHLILILFSFLAVYPIFVMVAGAFKFPAELTSNASGFPKTWTLSNFQRLLNYNSGIIVRTFMNSIFIGVTYVVLVLFFASMAGFAFSKFEFKGKNIIFAILLTTMMIPGELNITPLYLIMSRIKWLNTYYVQIFPGIANVFALFFMRQYMQSISGTLIEAARIDGAGYWKIYSSIMLPISKPALASLAILVFLSKWNDLLFPKVMITKEEFMPIMVILPTLNEINSARSVPWELLLAGCTLVTLPLVICFLLFQNYFLESAMIGAVKG